MSEVASVKWYEAFLHVQNTGIYKLSDVRIRIASARLSLTATERGGDAKDSNEKICADMQADTAPCSQPGWVAVSACSLNLGDNFVIHHPHMMSLFLWRSVWSVAGEQESGEFAPRLKEQEREVRESERSASTI